MTTPAPGDPAPAFTLPCDDGTSFSPADALGKPLVLAFYPQDDTEGCTTEAKEFSALVSEFDARGIALAAISPDSVESHAKFRAKFGLTLRLVADPDHVAISAYGVWGPKKMFGKPYRGLIRTSFVIGPDGAIARVVPATRIKGHAAKTLALATELVGAR